MQKILIIQTAFIGDVVLATALIEKLHTFYPQAQIDFLLRKGNEGLLAGHPFLHEVLVWNKKNGKYKDLWRLLKCIRSTHYDMIVNVQRFAATGFLTAFSGAAVRSGFKKNPFSFAFTYKVPHENPKGQILHEIDRNQRLIAPWTDARAARPRLYPAQRDFDKIKPFVKKKYICLAPASVWYTKQYPKEKWAAFLQSLTADWQVFLLGGPGDRGLCEDILQKSGHPNTLNLAGQLSFLESAALQSGADMNYTNDSAPMHFASATNAPVAAVYCSTVPAFGYGPLSDRSYVIETKHQLACRPCGIHGHKECPKGNFLCAETIENGQLQEVVSPNGKA